MNDIDVKEYFDEEDCDAIILYLIDKADLSYGQALQVLEMLGRMVNIAATRIAKEMGVIWDGQIY